jgi:1,4-alpha-glucan branching enzyme
MRVPGSAAHAPGSAPRALGFEARATGPANARDAGAAIVTGIEPTAVGAADPLQAHRVADAARLACIARDPASAFQVWSGTHGYPGDGAYLEFHKKRDPGGLRYWAVTDTHAPLDRKRRYAPEDAAARVVVHARHFAGLVAGALSAASEPDRDVRGATPQRVPGPPLLAALFDTELFGHWWFEGPAFLERALEEIERAQVEPVAIGDWLERHPPVDVVTLGEGSWGEGGDHRMWWNEGTREAWRAIHATAQRFEALADRARGVAEEPLLDRLLVQSAREVLLLEASDWTFLITSGTARDYAERRILEHAADAAMLLDLVERRIEGAALSTGEVASLGELERRDALFPDLQWREAAGL